MLTRNKLHFILTACIGLLLIPACMMAKLRIAVSLSTLNWLLIWGVESIVWAAILYMVYSRDSWSELRKFPARIVSALFLTILTVLLYGPATGIGLGITGFSMLEFYSRRGNWRRILDAILVWLYLAFGIDVAVLFSSVVVTFRPCTAWDSALNNLDAHLMFGLTVVTLSHRAAPAYGIAELVYYGIFGLMGAGILFLCLAGDQRAAFQMCGAILVAYYLSLVIFWFIPALGPFAFGGLPMNLWTSATQHASLINATFLYHHAGWVSPPGAYYVAFPSLHMAQPLIVAWFLRRWRWVSRVIFGYCVLLVPAILILQWHYLVDILGGLAVAFVGVLIVTPDIIRPSGGVEEVPGPAHSFAGVPR